MQISVMLIIRTLVLMCVLGAAPVTASRPFSTASFFGLSSRIPQACESKSILFSAANYRGGSKVKSVKSISDFDEILDVAKDGLVVVDFSAAWCMPCKMISPVFEAYSNDIQFKDTVFVKVDVDDSVDIAMKYGVQSMPTFLFLKHGQVIERFSGADASKLRDTIVAVQ